MNRWLTVVLSFIPAALLAGLSAYFGAYAGLARGTHWQQVFAAVVFVAVVAGWLMLAARQLTPARPGGGLRSSTLLALGVLATVAASAIWLLLFWT